MSSDLIANRKEHLSSWENIYGDLPKEHIALSKPILFYISSINRIVSKDKELLLDYFPHLRLIRELNEVTPIRNILEVGCGSGIYSYVLYRYFEQPIKYYLIDYSKNAVDECQKLFGIKDNVYYIKADGFNIPLKDKSVDACITGGLIEHFGLNEQNALLNEVHRVSSSQIHQYPINNTSYWMQRFIISLFNRGKWPFGFEEPLTNEREMELFSEQDNICFSYLLKRLEFRLFTNQNFIAFKAVRTLNKTNIYRCISSDKIRLCVSK